VKGTNHREAHMEPRVLRAGQGVARQIFLSYAVGKNGETLYEQGQRNPGLLLGDGNE
jgi:hypothetical protein